MNNFQDQKADALRFIAGFEIKHGRGATAEDVIDSVFGGAEGLGERVICALVIEGKVRRSPRSRSRRLQPLLPVAVPRAPDGEPLYFVRTEGALA